MKRVTPRAPDRHAHPKPDRMNLKAVEFLGALSSKIRADARPMAEVHAHLDDILKSYPDAAP